MNKDAYYFPHDSNAKDDPKCLILIEELGLEGYGIFWVLIETLRDQKDFKAPIRIIPALARRYNTSSEKIRAVVKRYELFEVQDEEFFFSKSLIERMEPLLEKKHHRKIGGIKGNLIKYNYATKEELDAMTDDEIVRLNEEKTGLSPTDRLPTVERSHKSIVKKSKEEESKVNYIHFDLFWDLYDNKVGRKKCESKWKSISESEKEKIMEFVPIYKEYKPFSEYKMKQPYTFLNSEIWNDDWESYRKNGKDESRKAVYYL